MADKEWNVRDFVERFKDGEFNAQLLEALDSLSPEQIEELERFLLMQGKNLSVQ